MFAGKESGTILSEPVMAIALIRGGSKSLKAKIPRVMVMDTKSDQLMFPGDIRGFLGVGSPEDIDSFWTKQSVEWHDDQDGIDDEPEGDPDGELEGDPDGDEGFEAEFDSSDDELEPDDELYGDDDVDDVRGLG